MTSLEPEILDAADSARKTSPRLGAIAFAVSLAASILGNVVQWRSNAAEVEKARAEASQLRQEAEKTAAEVRKLQQEQSESGERSVQSWLEELKKFDAPEDRAMVLSAAISTTSDDRVKSWARDQLKIVEQALAERKRIAEAQLAIAEQAAQSTPTPTLPKVAEAPTSGSTQPPAMSPPPPITKDPKAAARVLATRDLSRINRAESLLNGLK